MAVNAGPTMLSRNISTLWVTFTRLDADLHKTALLQTLSQLSKNGNRCSLIAVQSSGRYKNQNPSVQVTPIPLRYKPFISTVIFTALLALLLPVFALRSKADYLIFDPDVHILSAFPALIALRAKKTKFVLDIRTLPVETAGLSGYLKNVFFSLSVVTAKKFFHGITIITPSMKEKVCSDFILPSRNVGVWTSGVSEGLFNPANYASEGKSFRASLGLSEKFVVFYHGVFSANRGLTQTVNAIKILQAKYPQIVLFLLGTGPIVTALKTSVKQNGLQENVIIADPVNQEKVPKYISMSDVAIIPLPDHPFWRFQSPLKLLEYLAMEKTVILTNIEAHSSVIKNTPCGIYISSIDPPEIAKAIEYAYQNSEFLEKWGKEGRDIILNRYTWGLVVEDLQNYLLTLK
jgi:glycosyltransferase involved in cell wall biosynthesis